MRRRSFIKLGGLSAFAMNTLPALAFQNENSKLKITGVRVVRTKPKRPVPTYTPAPGSWSNITSEVATPMAIYPEYKANMSSWNPDPEKLGRFTVAISTDKGLKGYGSGIAGAGNVVEGHFVKLLVGEDPFNIERIWDILYRSTLSYGGQAGAVMTAISAVDIALWDLVGNALGVPVYKLLGGETKPRIPAYCTGNDVEQHLKFGFKRVKVSMPHSPADGWQGQQKNVELIKKTREMLGPDGDLMIDCYMSWNEQYTIEMAGLLEPYHVYWMEEPLQPRDYEGFGRLRAEIKSTRIATGEHEYTRYAFRELLEHRGAAVWQPDIHWCGGLTELRRIGALAAAYDIPVIPHGGGSSDSMHYILATTNSPWAEFFMPPPGGPDEVYRRFEEDNQITRGPEGIYARPSDRPGLGWDFEVV